MTVEHTIISIGALSHNPLWSETRPARTPHATTTLVETEGRLILVDPGLPAAALAARFNERTGKTLDAVTDVFCTTLRPAHRRGLPAMPNAAWWCTEDEKDGYLNFLAGELEAAERNDSADVPVLKDQVGLIRRFRPTGEKLAPQVTVYPLAGPSAGSAGLLLTPPTRTTILAGDAALTAEHVARGQVWQGCADAEAAMRSIQDMLELADEIVPGHDNTFWVSRNWM